MGYQPIRAVDNQSCVLDAALSRRLFRARLAAAKYGFDSRMGYQPIRHGFGSRMGYRRSVQSITMAADE